MKTNVASVNQVPWLASLAVVLFCSPVSRSAEPVGRVDFNRQIRPILSENCFQCHGPDKEKRRGDLRLDQASTGTSNVGVTPTVLPNAEQRAELIRRIAASDEDQMPPRKSGRTLTPDQAALLRRWVTDGAEFQPHWSLRPPVRTALPKPKNGERVRNPIDAFVLKRLEQEGMTFAAEADRATLLRRASFDLTGLPPTLEELDAFLGDRSEQAFERVVDRLLASSRFGERMAVRWLDGARYADTNGYQNDGERFMWRWRDWVIEAYNRNLPFDQFSLEQLAGDLLPNPTLDQRIATGFHRNHRGNAEGGIIPEEYAVEYVADRVETTYTVWLGLTMGCARCHDHKFDPLSQREFYESFAFFNNIPEFGRAVKFGNSPPLIKAPTRDQQAELRDWDQRLTQANAKLLQMSKEQEPNQRAWEQSYQASAEGEWSMPATWRPELGPTANHSNSPCLRQMSNFAGAETINAGDIASFGFDDKFSFSVWVFPTKEAGGTILSRMVDLPQGEGYSLVLDRGSLQLNLVKRWLDDALRVRTQSVVPVGKWSHITATYDGRRLSKGIALYVDGKPIPHLADVDSLNQTFATKEPLRIGAGNGLGRRFHGKIADVRIFSRALTATEAMIEATSESISTLAKIPSGQRTPGQVAKLKACFLEIGADPQLRSVYQAAVKIQNERQAFFDSIPTTMVMEEMAVARPTHILIRGEYNKPGAQVKANTPASLPAFSSPPNRLGLARWLFHPQHPLTSRVAVNRLWQMLFGVGLVKTVDDFGAQGELPSHPELLDWLALEFAQPTPSANATPWDTKRMLRLMMTSATYRQASNWTGPMAKRDPENRLLGRGPRRRMSAEMVRDQALFASGLLVEKIGGPSVKPYQPAGLWKELSDTEYIQDHYPNLYRRSLYTFWKRTSPPPTMLTFDAAGRETCLVRESRTNTPLQALILMNDVTFVEASRALAERVARAGSAPPQTRLDQAFRLVTSRAPTPREQAILLSSWQSHWRRFQSEPAAAEKWVRHGEKPVQNGLPTHELAAYAVVCNMLLNLDEAVTLE